MPPSTPIAAAAIRLRGARRRRRGRWSASATTASGIPADLLPRIFDLFVQGDRTLDRSQGGLGIGLSVVKRLSRCTAAALSVVSDGPGCGSRFEIPPASDRARRRSKAPLPALTVTPRRILVVDDNEDAANSLTMVLSFDGHEVECAYNAEEALERAPSFKPDVALLDVGLPRMSGYELAQHMRALPGFAKIYLVALTGYGQPEDKARALAAGFDGHLVKPAEFRALQELLERMPR